MHKHTTSKSTRLRKSALYKAGMYLLAFTLAFAAYIQSEKKAEAIGFAGAVPLGIEVGAGVYVGAALITAGAAGLIGYDEHQEAINAHASNVMSGAHEAAKTSLKWSIDASVSAGKALVPLGTDFLNWSEKQIDSMAEWVAMQKHPQVITNGTNFTINGAQNSYASLQLKTGLKATFNSASFGTSWRFEPFGSAIRVCGSYCMPNVAVSSSAIAYSIINQMGRQTSASALFAVWNSHAPADQQFKMEYTDPLFNESYNTAVSQTREQWESMRDAGLVLPTEDAVPLNSQTNEPLTYNPDANTYTGIDGGIYTGVPSWQFPIPVPRTGEVDIPDGIYTDSPTLTGNPTYDQTLINNPAVPKTTTNINTGTKYPNPKFPTSPTSPTTPTPKPLPRIPNSAAPVPALVLLAFFDLLRALLLYLVRMFNWIMTIPFIEEKPIDNPYFQWFRQAKILGVYPYALVTGMATFFLGFKLVKAVRSFLP